MFKKIKKIFSKPKKDDLVERGLKALELLKLDTRVKPMKNTSVSVEDRDLSLVKNKLDYISNDIRYISDKLRELNFSVNKLTKKLNENN